MELQYPIHSLFLHFRTTILRDKYYEIPGKPISWKRPGGTHQRYDTQADDKMVVGLQLRHQHGSLSLFEGCLNLSIVFHMPIPKNTKNPEEWIGKYVDKVPDLDNLTKFYKDVGTGILYHDDKQIVKISALKVYNTYIGTTIRLQEMRQERYDR